MRTLTLLPILLSAALPLSAMAANPGPFSRPHVEPTIASPSQSVFYVANWNGCGSYGTPTVTRVGNVVEIVQPFVELCGIPYLAPDLRIDLGAFPPGAYSVRLLPCSDTSSDCIPAIPLEDVPFRVDAGAGAAASPVPSLQAAGIAAAALGLFALAGVAMRRRHGARR